MQKSRPSTFFAMLTATEVNLRSSARPAQATPGQCTGSWVRLTATVGVFKHTSPNPSDIDYYLSGGQYHPCRALLLGDRYSGCGYTNANGYILIPKIIGGAFYALQGHAGHTRARPVS
ncbi:hypothetical protein G7043_39000 [Lentzea sp. NEAU-D13]|uniref:Uncharacterized protein n=1 Tax=Lentzea alba TaxID=2714351 RepID=A0A7C9W7J9_9PSEU|nr:hypothetical protein [Lentzea alba]NGY64919.1 hypothetical protein [Lentzea alba]